MRLRTRLERLSGPSAVAIGNFDGFHAGHRRIIDTLAAQAGRHRLIAAVLTFHPHPRIFFGQPVRLISTDAQRLETLKRQALDRLFFIDFADLASIPAAVFVNDVLLGRLQARRLVVGGDFRFGCNREGDLDLLRREAAGRCAVIRAPDVEIDGQRVASSLIRRQLAAGDVAAAGRMLERPYAIDGIVVHGAGRGTELGFPTMNIASANDILPPGVFHTELEFARSARAPRAAAAGRGMRRLVSATFIGRAPAFTDPRRPLRVETHVPGFQGRVYGRKVRLHFIARIREERKFTDPGELVGQIRRDIAALGI
jgi:riboflavin kinase/FMN adenylyltransferase